MEENDEELDLGMGTVLTQTDNRKKDDDCKC